MLCIICFPRSSRSLFLRSFNNLVASSYVLHVLENGVHAALERLDKPCSSFHGYRLGKGPSIIVTALSVGPRKISTKHGSYRPTPKILLGPNVASNVWFEGTRF